MAAGTYIGRSPVYGAFQRQVFTGTTNGSTTVFTLNIAVPAAEALMVVISGVVQEPSIAYVASGTTLSLTGAPATGEQFYVVYLGNQLVQAGAVAAIVDADSDTQIQVEESSDDDTIRFDAAGAEAARISATGLDIAGSNKELRFYEAANYVGFEAPALSANQIWVLPAADGTNGQMLSTNGSGTLAWATASSTVTGLTDTTISSIASGELLKWNGSAWINNTLAEAGIAPVASPDFTTAVNLLARGELRFQDAAGGQYVGFEAPATVSSNVMWVLPAADGTSGQAITTNGSATLAWSTVGNASLATAQTFTAGQRGEITSLTSATTVTIDMALSNNFACTMTHNITFANPSNLVAGQAGSIFLTQDGTGSRTASWGSQWDFKAGAAPTLTTTAAAVDRIDYVVRSASSIHAIFSANYS